MRTLLAAALLLAAATISAAEDAPKPIEISLEPLGDRDGGVVARVFFRFANPRAITEAGLFLDGSFRQKGQVPRNFRFSVPRRDTKRVGTSTHVRNGKIVRQTVWATKPDQQNQMATRHTFAEGEVEVEARLILEADYGGASKLVAEAAKTFTVAKTNRPYVADTDADTDADADAGNEDETSVAEPEAVDAVAIRTARRKATTTLFAVNVDVQPPVKRVEFWVENKRVLARNAPPYVADLDLGDSPKGVALRAIGFDAAGHYVDADAFVVNEDDSQLAVKITRTITSDGFTHFKLSVHNPKGTPLKSVALYAGDKKLYEWDRPPYALSISTASLEGVGSVRAAVVDEGGAEASDVQSLNTAAGR
jgi:hypothetical protein